MKLINQVLLTSALALPSLVSAASSTQTLQVHVPFSIMFAAGDYRIQQTDNGVIIVQGEGKAVAALSNPAEFKPGTTSSLRFTSADQHYLTGVQVQGESSRSIPVPSEDQRKLSLTSTR